MHDIEPLSLAWREAQSSVKNLLSAGNVCIFLNVLLTIWLHEELADPRLTVANQMCELCNAANRVCNMKFPAIAIVAALSAIAASTSAHAATIIITYSGIINAGYDVTGVFGSAGQNLTGISYTSVYTLTDPTPGAIVNDDGISSSTYGGTNYMVPTPVSGNITINGVTRNIGGTFIGIANHIDGMPTESQFDLVFHEVDDFATDTIIESNNRVFNVIQSYNNNIVNTSSYLHSLSYTVQPDDVVSGAFQFFTGNPGSGTGTVNAFGSLTPQMININGLSFAAVPESTTWAMMLIGFGVIGAAGRNRRAKTRVRFNLN
jgi:hypothetical protein